MYYSSKGNAQVPSSTKPQDMFMERARTMVRRAVDAEFDFFCNGDDYFDDEIHLDKVHRVMEFLQWHWVTSKTPDKIPSKEEIRNEVEGWCNEVYENAAKHRFRDDEYRVSCGGFTVSLFLEDMDKLREEDYNEDDYDVYIECKISFDVI